MIAVAAVILSVIEPSVYLCCTSLSALTVLIWFSPLYVFDIVVIVVVVVVVVDLDQGL